MSLTAIILAAGKSTRMKSRRPKVLHEVCGRPMLDHVMRACYAAGCQHLIVVVGHGKEEVMSLFAHDRRITWVEQLEQQGTGHAAQMCVSELKKIGGEAHRGDVFILAGDGPLIRGDVLKTLLQAHHEEHAAGSMATAVLDDPTGYGRVIRDGEGNFVEIIEQLDATPAQREIKEVFPSYYCVRIDDLLFALSKLTNDNKKGEYYLTDIFGILKKSGRQVAAVQAVAADDVIGVNTRQHLADVDAIMQERIQRQAREAGVTIVSPINTYIEAGANIGPDTVIEPFSFVGRDSSVGRDCTVGPFACLPRESILPDGASVAGNVTVETAMLDRSGS